MTRRISRPGPSARGFTLIELMVALGMALGVTAAAMGVLLTVLETQRAGFIRVQLTRDVQLAMDMLEYDLGYLGVGAPRGFVRDTDGDYLDPTGGGGEPTANGSGADEAAMAPYQLRPAVRVGTGTTLAFLGDLPYPNAESNGIMEPTAFSSDDTHRIGVVSDLTPCTPPDSTGGSSSSGNYVCNSETESVVPLGGGGECGGSDDDVPTCPWSMNKVLRTGTGSRQIPIVVSDVGGGWYLRWWDYDLDSRKDREMMHFEHQTASWDGSDEDIPESFFRSNRFGGGFMATMDRVFWKLADESGGTCNFATEDCALWRRQCWGWGANTLPNAGTFPGVGSTSFNGALTDPVDCTPASGAGTLTVASGTPWEQIVGGLTAMSFSYFDSLGGTLTPALNAQSAARVGAIGVSLTIEDDSINPNAPLSVTLSRRFYLDNSGGLVTGAQGHDLDQTPEANGGCWLAGPPNDCSPQ